MVIKMPDTIKTIKQLIKKANEAEPVNTFALSMWTINRPNQQDIDNRFCVASEQLGCMSKEMPVQIHIHPNTSIDTMMQSLEYIMDCIRFMEFPDWDRGFVGAWLDSDTIPDQPLYTPDINIVRTCERCGYNWTPIRGIPPKVCPSCKSRKWNVQKP